MTIPINVFHIKMILNFTVNFICRFIHTFIMKRNIKHWWSTIPPISTKQTITVMVKKGNNHPSRIQNKDHDIYQVGNPCPGLGEAQKCGVVMGSQFNLPSWLSYCTYGLSHNGAASRLQVLSSHLKSLSFSIPRQCWSFVSAPLFGSLGAHLVYVIVWNVFAHNHSPSFSISVPPNHTSRVDKPSKSKTYSG